MNDHDHDPIDDLLAGLREDVPEMTERSFASTRTHLVMVIDPPTPADTQDSGEPVAPQRRSQKWRSPPRRLAVSAAAVVALAAGAVVWTAVDGDLTPNAAAERLNSAADRVTTTDAPVGPEQYRYVVSRYWSLDTIVLRSTALHRLMAAKNEVWIPADPSQDCTQHSTRGEEYQWLVGSDEQAEELGIDPTTPTSDQDQLPCGDFADGSWQQPSTDFLASLPRDPQALYDRLVTDTEGHGSDPDLEVLVYAADALRTSQVPPDLRAALYRALALVPDLEITEEFANLDGHRGTAYGITRSGQRHDVIIDPATGQYIGERQVDLDGVTGVPEGTVISYTSVDLPVVVDEVGETG